MRSTTNPLSIWTYFRRHWQRTALFFGLISLTTLGLYLIIALLIIFTLGPLQEEHHYLQNLSLMTPRGGNEIDASLLAQVRAHPEVSEVVPATLLRIEINTLLGRDSFHLFGLRQADVATVMASNRVTLKSGRQIQARASEMMLSEELAANLSLTLGDQVDRRTHPDSFAGITEPMTLVGVLAGDTTLGIIPYEYLSSHESYRNRLSDSFLVIAKAGHEQEIDDYLVNTIDNTLAELSTRQLWLAERANDVHITWTIFTPIALLLATVVTVVIAVIKRIELARRLPELGILYVVGHSKKKLTQRLATENATLVLAGWSVGIAIPWLLLATLNEFYFAPRGYGFQAFQLSALLLTMPIPIAILLFVVWGASRSFARVDGIALIEGGELEAASSTYKQHGGKARSSLQPLSPLTFYRRHSKRTALFITAMALMIMVVVALIFSFTSSEDALRTTLSGLTRMSQLYPIAQPAIPAATTAQLRTHPAVERVISTVELYTFSMEIPPFSTLGLGTYALNEEDMRYLMQLYGLQIKEGRLPKARTNEIIMPEAMAMNRQLHIGDVIGRAGAPAYEGDTELPAPFVIVGIFARASTKTEENWLSFASLEFVQSHEAFDGGLSLLVVPKPGQKQLLDDWLENEIEGNLVTAATYRKGLANMQANARGTLLAISLIELVLALMAAITMAVLNYIFLTQRQNEFGVLNALGYGRGWLMRRTLIETLLTSTTAWAFSVLLCAMILAYMDWGIYRPMGLPLNFTNPLPWFFTLPVPVAVFVASTLSIRQMLYKLDTVAIIERN